MTLLQEIRALAAELLNDCPTLTPDEAFAVATAEIDAMLRYAWQNDGKLTDPKVAALNLVSNALAGRFKLI